MFTRLFTALMGLLLIGGAVSVLQAAPASAGTIAACTNPNPPSWWATRLQEAADYPDDSVPSSWGTSVNIARIVCRESDFNYQASNGQYYGLAQMSRTSVADYTGFSWDSYVNGSSSHPATWYQLLAALRYAKGRYGDTSSAWASEVNNGYW